MYNQTCIKRTPLGQRRNGLLRQVTSYKRFKSYEIVYNRRRKGDLLIQVITWDCFTVYILTSILVSKFEIVLHLK